jgi:hypothetical protein
MMKANGAVTGKHASELRTYVYDACDFLRFLPTVGVTAVSDGVLSGEG